MPDRGYSLTRLDVVKREQTPQALARLVVVGLFIALWLVFYPLGLAMPLPFLVVLCLEALFFVAYLPAVRLLPSERGVELAHYAMLGSEIVFHTTMVYFLGGITWLGPFAYIFGLIFTNAYLDLRRGAIYTMTAASAFLALILLEATGAIPHYTYLDQSPDRYRDATFVVTTAIAGVGVFFSIYLWINWVGHQLRQQRDDAVIAQSQLAAARADLERTNAALETRVSERTSELRAVNAALHAGEGLLRDTIESTADAILVVDRAGQILHANERFASMWHIPPELLSRGTAGGTLLAHAAAQVDDADAFASTLRALSNTSMEGEGQITFRDGRVAEHFSRPLVRAGAIDGRVWSFRDITSRTKSERERDRLTAIIEATTDVVVIAGVDGRRLYMNSAGRRLLDIADDAVDSGRIEDNRPDWARVAMLDEGLAAAERYGVWISESAYLSADGHEIPVSQVMLAHRTESGVTDFYSVIARDISERKRTETQLVRLANQDALTGLFNRRRFVEELDRELREARRYGVDGALLFLDLDQFKDVNDSRGHRAGDDLLTGLAELLRQQVRSSDVVARLGGDEFAVLLPRTDAQSAAEIAAQLLDRIRDHTFLVAGAPLRITASIGVALFPEGSERSDDVLSRADLAMYRAKEEGRNRYSVFVPDGDWQAQIESRIGWTQRIREAIERDRFVLYAQPILRLADGAVDRYELLLRLDEGGEDVVLPGAFLDLAERTGMIQDIDRWVVREAIGLLAAHAENELRFEVNLSGKAFADPQLLPMIQAELARRGVDPARLILEVTETAAIANLEEALTFVRTLKSIGCGFALDDFGVGFSSFSHLKNLPVDYLKIDGSFVRELPRSPTDQHLVRAIVAVAAGLGKRTIAEFVTEDATLRLLEEYGVDYAQGFWVGEPEPCAAALARRRPPRAA
ncbi:MAG: EAL domain-containing protein [Dehalococcoidia bacterium]|nr:EAL domain-containing protein [Dehalococcoidia bacterium]